MKKQKAAFWLVILLVGAGLLIQRGSGRLRKAHPKEPFHSEPSALGKIKRLEKSGDGHRRTFNFTRKAKDAQRAIEKYRTALKILEEASEGYREKNRGETRPSLDLEEKRILIREKIRQLFLEIGWK